MCDMETNAAANEFRYYIMVDGVPATTPIRSWEALMDAARRTKRENPNSIVAVVVTFEE